MTRMSLSGRRTAVVMALLGTVVLAKPAYAQNYARIYGVVTDAEGQPVADATVVVDFQGDLTRQYESTTNDEGEFMQMGLSRGPYGVTVTKEGVGAMTGTVTLRAGQSFEMNIELLSPEELYRATRSEEELAELARIEAATDPFDQGVDATRSGNLDEAVARFNEALEALPDCGDCHRNLGIVYTRMEDYAQAESAFKRALELAPDDAAAYKGLADVYNAQRRFDDAGEASAQAAKLSGGGTAQGGSATAVFDQGLIFWNAGRIAEARRQFEQTLTLDPDHGEAHYWLGMANLNEGKVPEAAAELKIYLDREPDGRFAAEAAGILGSIQP